MMPRVLPAEPGAVPILVWARALPDGAEKQLRHIAARPYVVEHVAAMPDIHVARGIAVGTVFATAHHVVPGALGSDLGCGVRAYRFPRPESLPDRGVLEPLLARLAREVPVGDAIHRGRGAALPPELESPPLATQKLRHAWERLAPRHLGTLGGGNHFLELDRDADGDVWLLLHTGSRGVGSAINGHHVQVARALGGGDLLAALDTDTPEGAACLADLQWACRFAHANREAIAARVLPLVAEVLGVPPDPASTVDVQHNHVAPEAHGGRTLLIHRKGAVGLEAGQRGLIPGSMGTASYVVEGRGEPRAFRSCSHGAGRVLSRTEARARIRPAALEHALRRVVYDRGRSASLVEEAPAVYRDITEVLEDEIDLVTPLVRLTPLAVLKG